MRGIHLLTSIRSFGIRDGFSFWFEWSFIDPIKTWIWLNITHKEWCEGWGWYCNKSFDKSECHDTHLKNKADILKRWDKFTRKGDWMECDFCGKEGNWNNIIRSTEFEKKDGSDTIVCNNCLNHYASGDYDKIKLRKG